MENDSKQKSEASSQQINVAKSVNAKVNNYFTSKSFQHTPYQELDLAAINDEDYFSKRFWFKPNMSSRQSVISFQRNFDLTNFQICLLYWSNHIRIKNNCIEFNKNNYFHILGRFIILFLMITAICSVLILPTKTTYSSHNGFMILLILLTYLPLILVTGIYYIHPHQLAKELQNQPSN